MAKRSALPRSLSAVMEVMALLFALAPAGAAPVLAIKPLSNLLPYWLALPVAALTFIPTGALLFVLLLLWRWPAHLRQVPSATLAALLRDAFTKNPLLSLPRILVVQSLAFLFAATVSVKGQAGDSPAGAGAVAGAVCAALSTVSALAAFRIARHRMRSAALAALVRASPSASARLLSTPPRQTWPGVTITSVAEHQRWFELGIEDMRKFTGVPSGPLSEAHECAVVAMAAKAAEEDDEVSSTTVMALLLSYIEAPANEQRAHFSEWAAFCATREEAVAKLESLATRLRAMREKWSLERVSGGRTLELMEWTHNRIRDRDRKIARRAFSLGDWIPEHEAKMEAQRERLEVEERRIREERLAELRRKLAEDRTREEGRATDAPPSTPVFKEYAARQQLLEAFDERMTVDGPVDAVALREALAEELRLLDAQWDTTGFPSDHVNPRLPRPDVNRLAVLATITRDRELWDRVVGYLHAADYYGYKSQKWGGTDPGDLGPFPTMLRAVTLIRRGVKSLELPAARARSFELQMEEWADSIPRD